MKVQVVCKSKHLKVKDGLYHSIVPHQFCIKWFLSPPTTFYIITSLVIWHILHLISCQFVCIFLLTHTEAFTSTRTRTWCGWSRLQRPIETWDFIFSKHWNQLWDPPSPYLVCIGGSFWGGKAVGPRGSPLTSI